MIENSYDWMRSLYADSLFNIFLPSLDLSYDPVAASKKRITVYDVVPNLLKGEYIKATHALIDLNPELTLTTTTGATAFTYLKFFVPWRHYRYVLFFIHRFFQFCNILFQF